MDRAIRSRVTAAPLVLCDFDGTLAALAVDWRSLKRRLQNEVARLGVGWDAAAGLDTNLRRIRLEVSENVFRSLCKIVAQTEIEGFRPELVNEPLVDILRLREDRPIAVVSANTHEALAAIVKHDCFDGLRPLIIGKEDVSAGKPNPEGLLKACDYFGIAPSESVYVGDAPWDRAAAKQAGASFIAVNMHEHDYTDKPTERVHRATESTKGR